MSYFLLVYDRARGKLEREQAFARREDAMAARFAAERTRRADGDIEVVVLGAESADDLRRTHSRYFKSVKELAS